jgi:hypothetical protein
LKRLCQLNVSTALPKVDPIAPSNRGNMLVEAHYSLCNVIRKLTNPKRPLDRSLAVNMKKGVHL